MTDRSSSYLAISERCSIERFVTGEYLWLVASPRPLGRPISEIWRLDGDAFRLLASFEGRVAFAYEHEGRLRLDPPKGVVLEADGRAEGELGARPGWLRVGERWCSFSPFVADAHNDWQLVDVSTEEVITRRSTPSGSDKHALQVEDAIWVWIPSFYDGEVWRGELVIHEREATRTLALPKVSPESDVRVVDGGLVFRAFHEPVGRGVIRLDAQGDFSLLVACGYDQHSRELLASGDAIVWVETEGRSLSARKQRVSAAHAKGGFAEVVFEAQGELSLIGLNASRLYLVEQERRAGHGLVPREIRVLELPTLRPATPASYWTRTPLRELAISHETAARLAARGLSLTGDVWREGERAILDALGEAGDHRARTEMRYALHAFTCSGALDGRAPAPPPKKLPDWMTEPASSWLPAALAEGLAALGEHTTADVLDARGSGFCDGDDRQLFVELLESHGLGLCSTSLAGPRAKPTVGDDAPAERALHAARAADWADDLEELLTQATIAGEGLRATHLADLAARYRASALIGLERWGEGLELLDSVRSRGVSPEVWAWSYRPRSAPGEPLSRLRTSADAYATKAVVDRARVMVLTITKDSREWLVALGVLAEDLRDEPTGAVLRAAFERALAAQDEAGLERIEGDLYDDCERAWAAELVEEARRRARPSRPVKPTDRSPEDDPANTVALRDRLERERMVTLAAARFVSAEAVARFASAEAEERGPQALWIARLAHFADELETMLEHATIAAGELHERDAARAALARRYRGAALLGLRLWDEAFAILDRELERPLPSALKVFPTKGGITGDTQAALDEARSAALAADAADTRWAVGLGSLAEAFFDTNDGPMLRARFESAVARTNDVGEVVDWLRLRKRPWAAGLADEVSERARESTGAPPDEESDEGAGQSENDGESDEGPSTAPRPTVLAHLRCARCGESSYAAVTDLAAAGVALPARERNELDEARAKGTAGERETELLVELAKDSAPDAACVRCGARNPDGHARLRASRVRGVVYDALFVIGAYFTPWALLVHPVTWIMAMGLTIFSCRRRGAPFPWSSLPTSIVVPVVSVAVLWRAPSYALPCMLVLAVLSTIRLEKSRRERSAQSASKLRFDVPAILEGGRLSPDEIARERALLEASVAELLRTWVANDVITLTHEDAITSLAPAFTQMLVEHAPDWETSADVEPFKVDAKAWLLTQSEVADVLAESHVFPMTCWHQLRTIKRAAFHVVDCGRTEPDGRVAGMQPPSR